MPTEVGRKTARKRVKLPGGGEVDVKVVTQISFIDQSDRFQETQYSVDNSSTGNRSVRVDTLGSNLHVERIKTWYLFDPTDRAQESQVTFDNLTGHDSTPPHFSAHLKTHVVRYKNDPDDGNYIDSELIDSFAMFDAGDRAQETVYTLNQPQTDDEAQADPGDPDISDPSGNEIDPPWRTDPFQNIIGFGQESNKFLTVNIYFGFSYKFPYLSYGSNTFCGGPLIPPGTSVAGGQMVGLYLKTKVPPFGENWTSTGFPESGRTEPFDLGSDPLAGPGLIDFPRYAQINKAEGTGYPLDLTTGEAGLYGDYSSNLAFNITWWDLTINEALTYQTCAGEIGTMTGGAFFHPTGAIFETTPVEFDLTGATVTDISNPTAPVVYVAIGTKNSWIPVDDPDINAGNPIPYNIKVTQQHPTGKPVYQLYELPFFNGPTEQMYSIPHTDILDHTTVPPSDDILKGYYLVVTVLLRQEDVT